MQKQPIVAPGIFKPIGTAHAIRVGDIVYTSGMLPLDVSGNLVGRGDISAQARQIYENLDKVLTAAGARWTDVAKYNSYLLEPRERQAAREVHFEYMPLYQRAGAMIVLGSESPDIRLQVEIIAHVRTPKHCITNVPGVFVPLGSPHAVRVGDRIYVTGQQAIAGEAPTLRAGQVAKASVHEQTVVGKGDITAQAELVYRNFDAILKAAGASWDDAVKATAYLTGNNLMEATRAVRARYLPPKKVSTTSVVSGLVGPDWLIEAELLAFVGTKRSFMAEGVHVSDPVLAHGVVAGNTLFCQGLVAWGHDGRVVGGDDATQQAEQVYRNLDAVLRGAGASWDNVVHVKSYHKLHQNIPATRQVRAKYLQGTDYAATDVIAGFFNPAYLLEVELIAVLN